MDKLIEKISRGVGSTKRKKGKSAVLIRLGASRASDTVLSSDDDSSDEDYVPPEVKTQKFAKNLIANKNRKPEKVKKRQRSKKFKTTQQSTNLKSTRAPETFLRFTSQTSTLENEAWSRYVPEEILLRIFQLSIVGNEHKLKLLLRTSMVCRLWSRVTFDPSLWHNLDLTYGWIKSPLVAIKALSAKDALSQLYHLNVSRSNEVNTAFIQFLLEEFPQLTSLNISFCKNVNADGLQLIANGFRHLEQINVSGINRTPCRSAATLDILKSNQETLENLELTGNDWKWKCTELLSHMSTMRRLMLLDISEIVLPSAPLILETLKQLSPTLRVLRMSRCTVKSHTLTSQKLIDPQQYPLYPQLVEFTAAEADLSSHLPLSCFVNGASNLKHLDIRSWNSIRLSYINQGGAHSVFPRLQSLNLRNVMIIAGFDLYLSQFAESLQELDISWMKGFIQNHTSFTAHIEGLVIPGSQLRALYCAGMPVSMDQLRLFLTSFVKLHTLDLVSCRSITRGLKQLHSSKPSIDTLRRRVVSGTHQRQ